ncbi:MULTISPECIES: OsmC family protein [unclassified Spirillospora]|uniref:OsmC family protein n=1 Tax=unclassified Spirillospora TaxID=2642701 RepID=UPI003714C212
MNDTTTQAAPTSYQVTASTTSAGRSRVTAGRETITLDTAWASAPSGLPGPAELLAAALAACLLKNVERCGQILPFRYRHAEAVVTAHRQDSPPTFTRFTYELRLDTDEPEHRVALLHRNLRRHGTVYNTLAATCEVQGGIVTSPPAATP